MNRTTYENALEVTGLVKRFGEVEALGGVDLRVPPGTVHGLLGHNGAGKTTAVRILTTLLRPDGGRALVCGRDVVSEAPRVREQIALAGQQATLDELLTGRENLVLLGRLLGLSQRDARARAGALLAQFDLVEAADRVVKTYSGGMRRRLDLAACLIVPRPVVLLDEPTTGLDPASRAGVLDAIRDLADEGGTVLLTTQYLEEADRLCDRITVLSRGAVVAEGTAGELKSRVGGRRVEVVFAADADLAAAERALSRSGLEVELEPRVRRLTVMAPGGAADLDRVLQRLIAAGVDVEEAGLRRPTLDDAFLALTDFEPAQPGEEAAA